MAYVIRNLLLGVGVSIQKMNTHTHFSSRIASTVVTQVNSRRQCHVCAHTVRRARRDTSYECIECNVGLRLMNCFKDYHTLKAF